MFVKLFTQILESSIADDRRLRHFFTDLLLCADAEGYVMMTETAIARRIGAPVGEVEWGLAELSKPDPRSKTPDHEGRRIERVEGSGYGWRVLNYEHYRALKDSNQLREATKLRVRRHREKKAAVTPCNVTVTPCNASNAMQREKQTQKEKEPSPIVPPACNAEQLTLAADIPPSDPPPPPLTPDQIEVGSWFGRRASTRWSAREMKAWKAIAADSLREGIALLGPLYRRKAPFLRRDLQTLLNNWQGEIDRAQQPATTNTHDNHTTNARGSANLPGRYA